MNITGKLISLQLSCMLLAVSAQVTAAGVPGDLQFQREGESEENSAGPFPPAYFPHWVHRVRYRCDACHDSLFEMKAGATPISMASIAEGKACGACHDGRRAFDDSFENCARCHRPPPD